MNQPRNADFYNLDFQTAGSKYLQGLYLKRNRLLASMIVEAHPKSLFEFACGEGGLSRQVLKLQPLIAYHLTDFSPSGLNLARRNRWLNSKCRVDLLDIDKDYSLVEWSNYDVVVSTSLEHLGNDRQIIASIKPSTHIFLSLPNYGHSVHTGHVRCFKNFEAIERRYGDLMDIKAFEVFDETSRTIRVKLILRELGLLEYFRKIGIFKKGMSKMFLIRGIRI